MVADPNLTGYDKKLAESVSFKIIGLASGENVPIFFQFAPKITGERNGSNWSEEDLFALAPLRILSGMQGRDIDMEWEYVATGTIWTGENIAANLRSLKTYFYEFNTAQAPLVILKYTHIVPTETRFTLRSLDIQYGPEIVGSTNNYPVYTKVLAKLQLASTLTISNEKAKQEEKMKAPNLRGVQKEWY